MHLKPAPRPQLMLCLYFASPMLQCRRGKERARFSRRSAPFQHLLGSIWHRGQGDRSPGPSQPAQEASAWVPLGKHLFVNMSDSAGFLPLRAGLRAKG